MQQLMIPFPEFSQVAIQESACAAKERPSTKICEAIQHFPDGLQKSVTKPCSVKTVGMWLQQPSQFFSSFVGEQVSRLNAICGTAAVVFSFAMISFAAVIGG